MKNPQQTQSAPLPPNEKERIQALYRLKILDTAPEPHFDDLTALAAALTGCPIALVSLIDVNRQWFKSRCGIDGSETDRSLAFCAHALLEDDGQLPSSGNGSGDVALYMSATASARVSG